MGLDNSILIEINGDTYVCTDYLLYVFGPIMLQIFRRLVEEYQIFNFCPRNPKIQDKVIGKVVSTLN